MSEKANYFKIGLFIITSLALAIIGIVVLRAGTFFQKELLWETYFDESVQGLEIGAPIKHRGVKVGKVKTIGFVRTVYKAQLSQEDQLRFASLVLVRMTVHDEFPGLRLESKEELLQAAIDEGLRIRLASQGVTGVVHLEADQLDPKEYPPLEISWKPDYFRVPSAPSKIKVVGDALSNIARDLEQANIHKATEDLDKLVLSVTKLVEDAQMEQLTRQAGQTLTDIQTTAKEAQRLLDDPEIKRLFSDAALAAGGAKRVVIDLDRTTKRINQASETLPETIARLEQSLKRMDRLIASKSQDLEQTIANLRQISDNVRDLTNDAKRYPSQVLFGEAPPRRDRTARP
jgi:phospholipid/cholesterol/gamma-HCH transport system substrate-binding protein/paraquat-inducible protein B